MPKILYIPTRFAAKSKILIDRANIIIADMQAQGFTLTLRQLHYQFVSRDWYANTAVNYNRLGNVVNDARLAGLIDWDAIEDRTRNIRALPHWGSPEEIIDSCAKQFNVDLWSTQEARVEVWIEKDALTGIIERACEENDVPYFSCRGYVSQSEMWGAAMRAVQRFKPHTTGKIFGKSQRTIVLHFGDHDPSGIDMTRDIEDRIKMFCARHGAHGAFEMRRMALNMDQVDEYSPPPNFAKVTDSRFQDYQEKFGEESWELDALQPAVVDRLIRDELADIIDPGPFKTERARQVQFRKELQSVSDRWQDVVSSIDNDTLEIRDEDEPEDEDE